MELDKMEWRDIAEYDVRHCTPVLVTARNRYGAWRESISAFNDATEVWRVLGSSGGMTRLGFSPTKWMPLPKPPVGTEYTVGDKEGDSDVS